MDKTGFSKISGIVPSYPVAFDYLLPSSFPIKLKILSSNVNYHLCWLGRDFILKNRIFQAFPHPLPDLAPCLDTNERHGTRDMTQKIPPRKKKE